MLKIDRITLALEVIEGRLYVCSDDVPGLILSGYDHEAVMADILPALAALLEKPSVKN